MNEGRIFVLPQNKQKLQQQKMKIAEIIEQLSQRLPDEWLKSKKLSGNEITYIPWHHANKLLDQHAPGWNWEIKSITTTADQIFIVGRLTITADDGTYYREATGSESLNTSSYGDPSSNAESMAFRRAAAKFGLGLYLYDKEGDRPKSLGTTTSKPQESTADICQQWVNYGKQHGVSVREIALNNGLPVTPAHYNDEQVKQLSKLIQNCIAERTRPANVTAIR